MVIAAELVRTIRERAAIDWWPKENMRMAMRVAIRRILSKHGFPPNLQDEATKPVLRQAEALADQSRLRAA
ncbi:DUF3387 domain-containing protein [Acuticoccus sp. 2012]|uniref:DUF3387 domain-containing protein n=1 Tax=Acuticoccus mangrovi TaxID=2796142 RepID=A0A934MCI2_9HYPH|nr:DUF3387 domain-containing protein [Acuticoccus mangrovi]